MYLVNNLNFHHCNIIIEIIMLILHYFYLILLNLLNYIREFLWKLLIIYQENPLNSRLIMLIKFSCILFRIIYLIIIILFIRLL